MSRTLALFENHPVSFEPAIQLGVYRAFCHHVVDGDTIEVVIDLGWRMYTYAPIRLVGIDTAEMRGTTGKQKELAQSAKKRVETLALNQHVLLKAYKEKTTFSRYLGDIFVPFESGDQLHQISGRWAKLQDILIKENLAKRNRK